MEVNKVQVFLFNIILFLYQFEFISIEGEEVILSFYRLGILPLLLIMFILSNKKIDYSDFSKYVVLFIYFSFSFITLIGYGYYSNLSTLIGNIIQLTVALLFFKNNKFNKSSLYVLATWGLFQLPYFITDFINGDVGLANRFVGFHWDPNYLCMSLLISFWAKVYLLKYPINKLLKLVILSLAFSDVLMILFSLSRGGLLALILTSMLYTFFYYRKIFYIIGGSSVFLISYMLERARWVTWSYDLSLIDLIVYRTFVISKEGDISAGRLTFIENYLAVLNSGEGVLLGMPLHYYIDYKHNGAYPHNSLIEILLPSGAIIGLFFFIVFLFQILKLLLYSFKVKNLPYEVLFVFSGLSVLLFLSFGLKIAWLYVGLVFAISNRKVFYKHFKINI